MFLSLSKPDLYFVMNSLKICLTFVLSVSDYSERAIFVIRSYKEEIAVFLSNFTRLKRDYLTHSCRVNTVEVYHLFRKGTTFQNCLKELLGRWVQTCSATFHLSKIQLVCICRQLLILASLIVDLSTQFKSFHCLINQHLFHNLKV